ncbi:coiled-coil domain-containing protein 58 [Trichonephila inaurata madagascariensis]|uniref:Protein MIX23 n=1 Tax=Trichonephila inaurata madagascariensis TaxID=2747483 RepID=A0A8X6Y3N3_9ARAC|nr:coiled-coil domain-containing protein 58 [Trichonephila inaurata madagascariensis]
MAAPRLDMACEDLSAFQESLRVMRKIDDNIVHALNTTIPTPSFAEKANATNQCQDLYQQLLESYEKREKAIKNCIGETSRDVQTLKDKRTNDPDNFELLKELRKVQTKFRLMQNELNIEEVVKDRSLRVFYERCRFYYKPPDLKL